LHHSLFLLHHDHIHAHNHFRFSYLDHFLFLVATRPAHGKLSATPGTSHNPLFTQTPLTIIGIVKLNSDVLDLLFLILHNIINTQDCVRIPNRIIPILILLLQHVNVAIPAAVVVIRLRTTAEVNRVTLSFNLAFDDAAAILQKAAAARAGATALAVAKLKIVVATAVVATIKAAFVAGIASDRIAVSHGKDDTICSGMIASRACPCYCNLFNLNQVSLGYKYN